MARPEEADGNRSKVLFYSSVPCVIRHSNRQRLYNNWDPLLKNDLSYDEKKRTKELILVPMQCTRTRYKGIVFGHIITHRAGKIGDWRISPGRMQEWDWEVEGTFRVGKGFDQWTRSLLYFLLSSIPWHQVQMALLKFCKNCNLGF